MQVMFVCRKQCQQVNMFCDSITHITLDVQIEGKVQKIKQEAVQLKENHKKSAGHNSRVLFML